MGTLFRQTPNNGYPFPPKWPLKMGTGLEASASHPRPNNIWVPPPPPPGYLPQMDDLLRRLPTVPEVMHYRAEIACFYSGQTTQ